MTRFDIAIASRVLVSEPPSAPRLRLFLALAAIALGACRNSAREATPNQAEHQLIVFAAASLREGFGGMADEFRKTHTAVNVIFNFAGTQEIRTQLEQGAAVDVFASADERHMKALQDAGRVEVPVIFTQNEPVLIVTKEQASAVRSFSDLPLAGRIVIAAPEVPIGKYTIQILDRAAGTSGSDFRTRVEAHVVSRELNVRQVLAKVRLGEADAGIVYRSDLRAADDSVVVVTIPRELNVLAKYPIAVVKKAPSPGLGRDWIALVLSPRGQDILRQAGFMALSAPSPTQ